MNEPICKKCKTPMSPLPKASGWLANTKLTITRFRCENCDHWNNLKPRKPKQPNADLNHGEDTKHGTKNQ